MCNTHVHAEISMFLKHSTQILSWTRWIPTELWRSSHRVTAGASGSPWSPTDPGAGTAVAGAGPSAPPPWRPHQTTPLTDPTGWWRRLLPRRRTRSSPRGSTPRTWWERCAAWSSPQAGRSAGGARQHQFKNQHWFIHLFIFCIIFHKFQQEKPRVWSVFNWWIKNVFFC